MAGVSGRSRAGAAAAAYQSSIGHCALNRQARGHWVRRRADGALTYMSLERGVVDGDAAADVAVAERAFLTNPPAFSLPAAAPGLDRLEAWGVPPPVASVYESSARIRGLHPWQVDALRHDDFGLLRGRNLVFCAPTSGGKTLVAEIAMLRTLLARGRKVLYVVPFVSLCREKVHHLSTVWAPLSIKVTGLYSSRGASTFYKTDVAVCTLERANGLLNRLVVEDRLGDVGLIVVDEVHLLGDTSRGFLLEMMLMKALLLPHARMEPDSVTEGDAPIAAHPNDRLQVVAMSATLPNIADLATWLSASLFTATSRPVPLDTLVECGGVVYDGQLRPLRLLQKNPSDGDAARPPAAAGRPRILYTQAHVVAAHDWRYSLTDEATVPPLVLGGAGDDAPGGASGHVAASLLLHNDGTRTRWVVERPPAAGADASPASSFTTARATLHHGHGAAVVPPADSGTKRLRALLNATVMPLWLPRLDAATHPRTCPLGALMLPASGAAWNGATDLQALPAKADVMDRLALLTAETVASGGCVIVFVPTPRAARDYALHLADQLSGDTFSAPVVQEAIARLQVSLPGTRPLHHALSLLTHTHTHAAPPPPPPPSRRPRLRSPPRQAGDSPSARATLVEQLQWTPCGCDDGLERCLRVGCAFHHGGLLDEERTIVETAFRTGAAPILFATSTLAAGVNLPATRVIVSSLTDYGGTVGTNLLTATRFRQMAGRAGRTGFAERGEVVLMVTDFRGGSHWESAQGFTAPPFDVPLPPTLPLKPSPATAVVLQLQDGRLGVEPAAARPGMHCARTWLVARQLAAVREAGKAVAGVRATDGDDPVAAAPNALTYAMTLLWGEQQPVRSALAELVGGAEAAKGDEEAAAPATGGSHAIPLRRALMELIGTGFLWQLGRASLLRILSHTFAAVQAGRAAVPSWCSPAVSALLYLLRNGFVVVRDATAYAPLPPAAAEEALRAMAREPAVRAGDGGDDEVMLAATSAPASTMFVAATALGMGCFLSSMSPEVALGVAGELHRAAMCLRNDCGDLHAVFLLTPVEGLDVQPDVAVRALSRPTSLLFVPLELRDFLVGPATGAARDARMKRLVAARALSVLMQESADAPMAAVAECLEQSNARGKLQTLQTAAGMHAAVSIHHRNNHGAPTTHSPLPVPTAADGVHVGAGAEKSPGGVAAGPRATAGVWRQAGAVAPAAAARYHALHGTQPVRMRHHRHRLPRRRRRGDRHPRGDGE